MSVMMQIGKSYNVVGRVSENGSFSVSELVEEHDARVIAAYKARLKEELDKYCGEQRYLVSEGIRDIINNLD